MQGQLARAETVTRCLSSLADGGAKFDGRGLTVRGNWGGE